MIAWRHDSAHGPVVAVTVAADAEAPVDERAAAARYRGERAAEYLAGRRALRAAIAAVDPALPTGAIGANARGAPVVPSGVIGSISHKAGLAVAVATVADGGAIGVDLELAAPRPTDIRRRVLTAAERAAIAHLSDEEQRRATVRTFAIKEAVYKAIDPYLRRYVGFLEVAVVDRDATLTIETPPAWGLTVVAACVARGDHWLATARAWPGAAISRPRR